MTENDKQVVQNGVIDTIKLRSISIFSALLRKTVKIALLIAVAVLVFRIYFADTSYTNRIEKIQLLEQESVPRKDEDCPEWVYMELCGTFFSLGDSLVANDLVIFAEENVGSRGLVVDLLRLIGWRPNNLAPVIIALTWDYSDAGDLFLEGARLAVEEINHQGGVNGRPVKAVVFDDKGDKEQGVSLALRLADYENVVAVVGHNKSSVAIPASIIYQRAGLLFISQATHPLLTQHPFPLVFRSAPSDDSLALDLARKSSALNYKRVLVVGDRTDYGNGLALQFIEAAVKQGLTVVSHVSYFKEMMNNQQQQQQNHHHLISKISEHKFDAIFLGGTTPEAGEFIRQLREMGVNEPVIGGDGLDSQKLWDVAKEASNGTIVSTIYHPDNHGEQARNFQQAFVEKYNQSPTVWSALAYDTLYLLKNAYTSGKSTLPAVAAQQLRYLVEWDGVLGRGKFAVNGDLSGHTIHLKRMIGGKWVYAPYFEINNKSEKIDENMESVGENTSVEDDNEPEKVDEGMKGVGENSPE